jgi:methionyl-tRNA formyltransferase
MNILFCINKDIYSYIFLTEFCKSFSIANSHVFYTQGVGKANPYIQLMRSYEQEFPELYASLSNEPTYFNKLESKHQLSLLNVSAFSQLQLTEAIQNVKPDLILSVRFGKIFKEPQIVIPCFGILNMHSGLLPDYRGILGTFWALRNNEPMYGYTIHKITDSTIDTGPVLFKKSFETKSVTCLFSAIAGLYPSAAKSMSTYMKELQLGKTVKTLNNSNFNGQYYTTPTLTDFETFKLPIVDKSNYLNYLKTFLLN